MRCVLIIHIGLVLLLSVDALPIAPLPDKKQTELMLPIESTTALMCDPIFKGKNSTAHWYKDGVLVATVKSDTNAVYLSRNASSNHENMPEVGFLIIKSIQKGDEGQYWCQIDDNDQETGELFYLKVAYVDPFPSNDHIIVEPENPAIGHHFFAHCPQPDAVPKPSVKWHLNGEPVTATSTESLIFPNGTLFIKYLSNLHSGRLECVVSNFASSRSTSIDLVPIILPSDAIYEPSYRCGSLLRIKILWFLIGCLVTSFCVLIYLLCVLLLLRPNHRTTFRPAQWLQSHPLLGPGFRKVITPVPDVLIPRQEQM